MNRRGFLASGLAAAAPLPALAAATDADPSVRLANDRWAIEVDPRTLALLVHPRGGPPIQMSRGVPGHEAASLARTETSLSWTWDGLFAITCRLDGADFRIAITASHAGELVLIDQPPEAFGRGLLLPLGEGYHVPADDPTWRAFLVQQGRLDTTEALSLPLWGVDHGAVTLHWLLTNPFNNALRFRPDGDGLALEMRHSFTTLAPATPMTLSLHLGENDLLAGAKRYRKHLIDSGTHVSLAQKVERTPSAARLIGATHLYLWGNGLIGANDVRDWPLFLQILKGDSPLAAAIRARLETDDLALVDAAAAPREAWQRRALSDAFNAGLTALARSRWQLDSVDPALLVAAYADLRGQVAAVFGPALAADPASWGEGLSKRTFAALREAGLSQAWIGLGDGWEGGLWLPEAVRAAADAGYLIAPYDSYETAIPPGQRADWATAQLGRAAYEDCAIIAQDGTPTRGFGREGHYTNTGCVEPIMKARVRAIARAAGYNSWFLDVFASGMVFDDYRPGRTMTMAQNAADDIAACRWISEELQLPAGSEDGKAVAAEGVLFGHGVETPVIGWGDADLQHNANSPFYLGGWYPSGAPTLFFRSVPMKEPYKTIYFTPATRLPLYQAVFHGAVISSHHWLFDQLKVANAMEDRALIQQLYNVPPLFHVSAATLAARLPAILRHDAFFRPVHARLAGRTLEGFDWLAADRLVQQTRFDDGTRLIANFDTEPRRAGGIELPPRSVTAIGTGVDGLRFTA